MKSELLVYSVFPLLIKLLLPIKELIKIATFSLPSSLLSSHYSKHLISSSGDQQIQILREKGSPKYRISREISFECFSVQKYFIVYLYNAMFPLQTKMFCDLQIWSQNIKS